MLVSSKNSFNRIAGKEIILCGTDEKMGSKDIVIKEWGEGEVGNCLRVGETNVKWAFFPLIRKKNVLHVYGI